MADKNNKTIKDWQPDDRPRERLLKHGASSLSDSELLAIILRTGTKEMTAKDMGMLLLERYGEFSGIEKLDIADLIKIKGIGKTKAITLAAVFEIARRTKAAPFNKNKEIKNPSDIARAYIPKMQSLRTEEFHVLLLSTANIIIRDVVISRGGLNSTVVHPREVFKNAISEMAAAVILLHNHPSGNLSPSQNDINITKQLTDAGKVIGIPVFDHIIIGGNDFYSFKANGLI
jgi:DNA repair protein RadC